MKVLLKLNPVKEWASIQVLYDMPTPRNYPKQETLISPLRRLRLRVGLTQSELANQIPDKTGFSTLSQRAVSAWERGEYQPELTIPQMKALCKALGVLLDELPDDLRPPILTDK
jgi:putative transcriptional regulator